MRFAPLHRQLARIWLPLGGAEIGPAELGEIARAIPAADLRLRGSAEMSLATAEFAVKPILQSADGAWALGVGGGSIDLTNTHSLAATVVAMEQFVNVAGNVFRNALGLGEATRIAFVREGWLHPDAVDGPTLGDRLLRPPPPFAGNPWEWDWRVVTTVRRQVGVQELPFETNTIAALRYQKVQILPEDQPRNRVRVELDINTAPAEGVRYTGEQVRSFFESVGAWHRELEVLLGRHVGVDDV